MQVVAIIVADSDAIIDRHSATLQSSAPSCAERHLCHSALLHQFQPATVYNVYNVYNVYTEYRGGRDSKASLDPTRRYYSVTSMETINVYRTAN